MKYLACAALAAVFLVPACVTMGPGMTGPTYHGASPEVCANIIARANQSPDPATKQYALEQAAKAGC